MSNLTLGSNKHQMLSYSIDTVPSFYSDKQNQTKVDLEIKPTE